MKFVSNSVDRHLCFGRRLGESLSTGAVISLAGCLGAGKTVIAKGVAEALGITRRSSVRRLRWSRNTKAPCRCTTWICIASRVLKNSR